jgi:hypothetical protein
MFDISNIFAGFVFGMIGYAGFRFGRSQSDIRRTSIGAILMVYPYFISNNYLLWGLGIALTAALIWWKDE